MGRKGFTLIEVMVAMVVLSIALLAVIKMNVMYIKANTYNHQLSAATMIAQEKMEELRGYARSDRTDKFSPFDFDFMLSEEDVFTTVVDTDAGGADVKFTVPGLSSNNGVVTLANGTVYATMAPSGGLFIADDFIDAVESAAGTTTFRIFRDWSIQPVEVFNETGPDYAHIVVNARWTDQYEEVRMVTVQSIVHRRQ